MLTDKVKRISRSWLGRTGLEIRKINRSQSPASAVLVALSTSLGFRKVISIVQIGANDGRFNDPIFPFVSKHIDRTRILLVEPQTQIIPFLRANYAAHPGAIVANNAVGPEGEMTLYAVSDQYWGDCLTPYADHDWPSYRAPSGITSTDRDRVVAWARKYYRGPLAAESVVIGLTVQSLGLPRLMELSGFDSPIDLLQVDAEGFDDQAIYSSEVEKLLPAIINFENQHLSAQRQRDLQTFLSDLEYEVIKDKVDTIAILRRSK